MIDLIELDKELLDFFTAEGRPRMRYLIIMQDGNKAMIAANLPCKLEAVQMLRKAISTIKDNEPLMETVGSA